MPDRDNIDDIYNIVKDDFNWIVEDMEQHSLLFRNEWIKCIEKKEYEETEEYKKKCEDIEKLIEKIENVKSEYISIIKGEENKKQVTNNDEYDYLEDWKDTTPKEILLFGVKYEVCFWRDVLLILIDVLYNMDKKLIDSLADNEELRGRKRIYFTYDKNLIDERFYEKTSYGLYIMTNASANTIYYICMKVLEILGYKEDDLKIKLQKDYEDKGPKVERLEKDDNKNIKLSKEYQSITIDRELFKTIIYSIINRKKEYGTDYIEPMKIVKKYEETILSNTHYTTSYHVVINIIRFLKDSQFIDNYKGTKKGKYVIVDDDSLKFWVENNI